MARSDRQEQPVTDEELALMPDRIGEHFDRIRALVARETDE